MKKVILLSIIILSIAFQLSSQTLHLYGGKNHDVYLGCLTCDDYGSSSIWNSYGKYGSNHSSVSIWNDYGDYGSSYSDYSPWNEYASNPPVVVDKQGGFYGYLTTNKYEQKRANFKLAMTMYKYYDLIRENVEDWYKKLFEE